LIHTVALDEAAFASARAVSALAELDSVRITRSKFVSRMHSMPATEVELTTSSKTEECVIEDAVLLFMDLTLRGFKEEELLLDIAARVEVQYAIPKGTNFTPLQLKWFARSNGMLNVWPYWRDFVQNTVVRAALPPLTLPLFRVLHKTR